MSHIKLKILTIALTVDLSRPFVWSAIQLMHVINGSLNSVAPAYAPGVFATYPQGRRGLLYRKDYVCQHSAFNKNCPIRQKTKDTGCGAKFSIKVCDVSQYYLV